MRWLRLRPTPPISTDEELNRVASELEGAANEAPPSRRVEETRTALLASLDDGGLAPARLLAAAMILAVTIGVGGPIIGSLVDGTRQGGPSPSPSAINPGPIPTPTPELPLATRQASPSAMPGVTPGVTPSVTPSPAPSLQAEPPTDAAGPAAEPTPVPTFTMPPQASPGGPPDPMPTPPATGPPAGVP